MKTAVVSSVGPFEHMPPVAKPFRSEVLRIVAFSDYSVQDISVFMTWLRRLPAKPDLILYAGDDIERFHVGKRNLFEEIASLSTHGLCAVLGNDLAQDGPTKGSAITLNSENARHSAPRAIRNFNVETPLERSRSHIRGKNVYNVHIQPLVVGPFAVIGVEGSPPDVQFTDLGGLVHDEKSIAIHLLRLADSADGKQLIVLSHCPPRETLDLAIRFVERHIGSTALQRFVLRQSRVSLVVCGHVHSCGGQTARLRNSTVVNVASHDDIGAPGRVAVLELQDGKTKFVEWHELWELRSICGIGEAREAHLKGSRIHGVTQLARASELRIKTALRCGMSQAKCLKARAAALVQRDAVLFDVFDLPNVPHRAYIDIETDLRQEFIWLIGLFIEQEARMYSFFAQHPGREPDVLIGLLKPLEGRPRLQLLSYSNCAFEYRVLRRRLAAYGLRDGNVEHIRDTYQDVHGSVAFSVRGTTLKDIALWCGFRARYPEMNGFGAAAYYGIGNLSRAMRQKLIEYNKDDVLALRQILKYVETRCGSRPTTAT
jgi:Icc-related predicted phosphoesterase